jgi:hypothetical protein
VNKIAIAIISVAMTATLAPAEAHAQSPGAGRAGQGLPNHLPPARPQQGARDADAPTSLGGQVQANLLRLEDDLRIGAGQQKEWDAYATRVIRLADDISRARFATRDLEGTSITAPQLFDRITDTAQNRLTAIEEIVEAGRALYAKLSAEQQKLADRRLALVALSLVSGVPPPGARPDDSSSSAKPRSP